ncbi:MAG TPA: hypothetical protein VHF45_03985 [Thermoleophilaceae bacterium]|nr:hypothetical protein [Thermoleophilaceae bacterium]
MCDRPILFVDVDGVISLFDFAFGAEQMPGPLHWVDGIAHCILQTWESGWSD